MINYANEKVEFKVVVSNNNDFALEDVIIKKNLKDAVVTGDDNHTIESDELIKFDKINAGESVEFVISYITKDNDYELLDSVVEILSSLAENDYEMKNDLSYQYHFLKITELLLHFY